MLFSAMQENHGTEKVEQRSRCVQKEFMNFNTKGYILGM